MKKLRKENSITIINIISSFILQGIAFLTTPVFTRMLGTEQFGLYSLFNSWLLIITCVMGLGIHASIGTGYYNFKEKYCEFRNSILLFSTIICLIESLILIMFMSYFNKYVGFNETVIVLLVVCAFGKYIVNFVQNAYIYEKKAMENFILSVGIAIFSVSLSILFISLLEKNQRYMGRIYGVVLIYIIASILVWISFIKKGKVRLEKKYLQYGIVVGFPIVFHSLSQNILAQSDRVMMKTMGISTSEIGIYSLFYTLSTVLSIILNALNNSWCPFYYDDINEKRWDILNKKCKNYIELFTVLSVGFILLSREISYLIADKSYWSGIDILPILAIAVYFTFMYQFPVNFEFFHKKTKTIAIGTVGAGILNIILNTFMIPKWGMYGAAIATAISYLALFFMHYYIVKNLKEQRYHLSAKIFIPGLIGMIVASIAFYIFSSWWYIRWAIGVILGCIELYRIYKRKTIF